MIVVELGGSITISVQQIFGQPASSVRSVLGFCLRRGRNLLGPGSPLLLVYVVLILPLSGSGFNAKILQQISIPKFIMSVIEATPPYAIAFLAVVLICFVAALLLSYTLPLIIGAGLRAAAAMKASMQLVWRHPGIYWRAYAKPMLIIGLGVGVGVGLWQALVQQIAANADTNPVVLRPVSAFLLVFQQVALLVGLMLMTPFQGQRLTVACYEAMGRDDQFAELAQQPPRLAPKQRPSLLDRIIGRPGRLIGVGLVGVLALALPLGYLMNDVSVQQGDVMLVGHRVGGVQAPENSLAALAVALKNRAEMVEVDVQRSADGHYVLNHDATFSRVAGDGRSAQQMTLAEIKELNLSKDAGAPERVPTLEEFLLAAKGKTKVLLELKGASADRRMVDDVVALVDRLEMREQVLCMSLDYPLVQYFEQTYPSFDTGFVYFLSFGDVGKLTGDYLIIEEGEASLERLLAIQAAGKKSLVWTVNDRETMVLLAVRPVDGIITDQLSDLRGVLNERPHRTSAEIWRDLLATVGR